MAVAKFLLATRRIFIPRTSMPFYSFLLLLLLLISLFVGSTWHISAMVAIVLLGTLFLHTKGEHHQIQTLMKKIRRFF